MASGYSGIAEMGSFTIINILEPSETYEVSAALVLSSWDALEMKQKRDMRFGEATTFARNAFLSKFCLTPHQSL